jgi:hypothetical protein
MAGTFMELKRQSYYMIPFLPNESEKYLKQIAKDQDFEEYYTEIRYLSGYVHEYFNSGERGKNHPCHMFRLRANGFEHYGLTEKEIGCFTSIIDKEEYRFIISDVTCYIFLDGISFFRIGIRYPQEYGLEDITNFNFVFSRLFQSKMCFRLGEQEIDLSTTFLNLVNVDGKAAFLPERRQLTSYHLVGLERENKRDEETLRFLSRGRHTSFEATRERSSLKEELFSYSPNEDVIWAGSTNAVCAVAYGTDGASYTVRNFPNHVLHDYFIVFLLRLYEREMLLWFSRKILIERNNKKNLIKMREKMVDFRAIYMHDTVSLEANYRELDRRIREVFCIEELEKDVEECIDSINSFVADRKNRRTDGLLTAIGLLAVISALTDGLGFADRVGELSGGTLSFVHFAVLGVVLIFVIIGVFSFFKEG